MNENEQDFDGLRRLLALKRHEVPPPGYFENLPNDIRARLRAGEANQAARVEMPWLLRLLSAFEAKPAFAGAFASALCMLLLGAIVFAERPPETVSQPLFQADQTAGVTLAAAAPAEESAQPGFITSTNPVLNAQLASAQLGVGSQPAAFLSPSSPAVLQPVSLTLP